MTTARQITKAQHRALSTILASGGLWPHDLHMGRLSTRPGGERKTMIARLLRMGLVEGTLLEAPHRQQYAGRPDTYLGRPTLDVIYNATAAGCAAFNAFEESLEG